MRRLVVLLSLIALASACRPTAPDPGDARADAATDAAMDAQIDQGAPDRADVTTDPVPVEDALDVPGDTAAPDAMDALGDPVSDPVAVDAPADTRPDGGTDAAMDAPDDADAAPCVPAVESCNGRDDDCDGVVDESACTMHLLITEIVATPTEGEFIEIHNPTSAPIVLTDVYLADFGEYANVVTGMLSRSLADAASGSFSSTSDFLARFPAGAMIGPGEYQTVAIGSPHTFAPLYMGACPTYYVARTAMVGTCTMSRQMLAVTGAMPASIGSAAGLTNSGEPVALFQWDGTSDRVQDLDYAPFGPASAANPRTDRTGVALDGPDMDVVPTPYLPDTMAAMQSAAPVPLVGQAAIRCDFGEGTERRAGGNGVSGHDETSENLAATWRLTPSSAPADGGMITTVNATPNAANNCR